MNEQRDLERLLGAHLAATADSRSGAGQLDAVRETIARTSQRPAWAAALTADGRAALGQESLAGLRVAAILGAAFVLLALIVAGLLAGGRRELAVNPPPPTSAPVVALLPTASPRSPADPTPTTFITPTAAPPQGHPCPALDELAIPHGVVSDLAWLSSSHSGASVAEGAGQIASWTDGGGTPDGTVHSDVDLVDPLTGTHQPWLSFPVERGKDANLTWSPDGSALAIAFSANCGSVTFVHTADGLFRLDPGPGLALDEARDMMAFSPDSTALAAVLTGAVAQQGHVWILPSNRGSKQDLAPACDHCSVSSLRWSPEGDWLAGLYQQLGAQPGEATRAGVAIADVAHGTWTVIPAAGGGGRVLGWQNDRVFLTVADHDGSTHVVENDAVDGSRSVLPFDADGSMFLLPDAQSVVALRSMGSQASLQAQVSRIDLRSGARTVVWTGPRGFQLGGGILAPDGSALVMDGSPWDVDQPTDSWVIRLDGSGARKLGGVDIDNGAWQPLTR